MNPVLLVRAELFCLVILLFMLGVSLRYRRIFYNQALRNLILCGNAHMLLNIFALIIIRYANFNNRLSISYIATVIIYVLYFISIVVFSSEFLKYVIKTVLPDFGKIRTMIESYFVAVIFMITLPIFGIQFVVVNETYVAYGYSTLLSTAVAFVDFLYAAVLMILNRKKVKGNVMQVLFPITIVAIILLVIQLLSDEMKTTSMAFTFVIIGFFFSNINSRNLFQSGNNLSSEKNLKSKSQFKNDLDIYNDSFSKNKQEKYIIASLYMNNIKDINNELGHIYGDEAINIVINSILSSLESADNYYRVGGVDFNVIYKNKTEEVVKNELNIFKTAVKINGVSLKTNISVSIGYAVSSETNTNLNEVVDASSFSLYRNRESAGADIELAEVNGISVNIAGLNDHMFDAISAIDDNIFPFIVNLDTNVMRISPDLRDQFGIANDIMYDLLTVWINHIHPDDRQGFIDDFNATVDRKQKVHNKKYRALNSKGEYIKCNCHGSIYKKKSGFRILAGYLETFGSCDANDDSWVK